MKALKWYDRSITRRPLPTKSATSFFIFGLGDTLSQFVESKTQKKPFFKSFNPDRTLRLSLFGAIYIAPILHNWYGFLG